MRGTLYSVSRSAFLLGLVTVGVLAISGCASGTAPQSASPAAEWSYSGSTGPEHWGDIAPTCAARDNSTGSPIDIQRATLTNGSAAPVEVRYTPAAFDLKSHDYTVDAVPRDPKANSIVLAGTTYYLQQFHFHADSEHTIDSQHSDMELHLVHKSDAGQLAVLGVMLKAGAENTSLTELFNSIPAQLPSSTIELHNNIDLRQLIPADTTVAQYDGSLTTPPCSEGVWWNVYLSPQTLSSQQISQFTALTPNNSRPVQPLNGRAVLETETN